MTLPARLRVLRDVFDPRYFNARSTLKSSLGFMRTVFGRAPASNALEDIFNFLPIDAQMATAGQPAANQFAAIRGAGYVRVINLAPHAAENALPDERAIVEGLGLQYVHLPVDFKNPTEQDFAAFCAAMQGDDKVFVHCAANMRVSAFTYRWRTRVNGVPQKLAQRDLEKIWKPFGVWAEFIAR